MSLDLNPDALTAARETFHKRDARNTVAPSDFMARHDGLTSARHNATDDEGMSFADQLRARQTRTDRPREEVVHKDEIKRPEPANNNVPAQETTRAANQTEAHPAQAANNAADQTQSVSQDQSVSQPVEAEATETVASEAVSQSATHATPEAILAMTQAVAAPSPDIDMPDTDGTEPKLADAPVAAVVAALNDLKSALKTELVGMATESETDKTSEPAITNTQLTELMQALLSGKPLSPELKALSETPQVAEALKAARTAMTLLDQPPQARTPDAALTLTARTDGQATKATTDLKATKTESDPAFGNLLDSEPVASQTLMKEAAVQTAKVSPAASSATPSMPKPSELLADITPAPVQSKNPAQALNQAEVKAAVSLQLKRSEAALGSSLSTAALNNITQMSAHIARHMTAKSTQFNMELYPADMGRVDVKLSVNHDGSLSAALRFDSPVAESQFRAQADDLRRQLEAHGFQLGEGALSFASRQDSDQANQGQTSNNNASGFADDAPDAARATQAFGAFDQTPDAIVPGTLLAQRLGLDLLGAQTYRLSLNVTA